MSFLGSILVGGIRSIGRTGENASTWLLEKGIRPIRNGLLFLTSAYCGSILFSHYVLDFSMATGPSMYPTMPIYDHTLFIDKTKRRGKGIKLGDCVQIDNPLFQGEHAGKRIVGMPGDYIVRDVNYAPSVGGAPMPGITDWRSDEEIRRGVELKDRTEPEMIEVPEGHVWVAGDNMSTSRDSRFYGAVPMALIRGRSIGIAENLFSYTSLGATGMRRIPKEDEEAYLKGVYIEEDKSEG